MYHFALVVSCGVGARAQLAPWFVHVWAVEGYVAPVAAYRGTLGDDSACVNLPGTQIMCVEHNIFQVSRSIQATVDEEK